MPPMRWLAVAFALGSVLGISCYSEPLPPSTYRYSCDGDGDCNANEQCVGGRCERPCSTVEMVAAGLLGADQPCPIEDGFASCINGACANTCALGSNYCTPGYTCLDIGLGSISGGGFGGSSEPVGVCTLECSDDSCPPGESCTDGACAPLYCSTGQACPAEHACFFGLCMVDCSDDEPCPEGQACFFGLCAPEPEDTGSSSSTADPGSDSTGSDSTGSDSTGSDSTGSGSTDGSSTGMGVDPAAEEQR